MRDIYIVLTVVSTVPFIFMQPHIGILVWCWLSYMNPHRLSWGFAYDLQFALLIASSTLIAWLVSKEPKRLQINAVSWFLLAFIFWMSFANLFALAPSAAYFKWEQSFKILLMTIVTMILMQTRERVHALVWVIVVSLGFFGLKGGIFTLTGGGEGSVSGPPRSFIADNNALAMALVMIVPLARYLQLQSKSRMIQWGMIVLMAATVFSIIGSHSRGAFLGVAAMGLFLLWKSRKRVVLGMLIGLLVFASAAFVPQKWVDRMWTIQTYDEDTSASSRIEAWTFGYRMALDRPLVGGGFRVIYRNDLFLKYVPDSKRGKGLNFHSVYFEILGELGFVGLFLYLGTLAAAWRSGNWIISHSRDRPDLTWADDLARMTQVSLVGFATAGAFLNLAYFDLYFHLIAIIFVTQLIVASALEQGVPGKSAAHPRSGGLVPSRHRHAPGLHGQDLQIRGNTPQP